MKSKCLYTILSIVVFVVIGYAMGVFFHPRIMKSRLERSKIEIKKSNLFSDSLYDYNTNEHIDLKEKLFLKKRNLLVFWDPNCRYCKSFFANYHLNDSLIGLFCFPQTDDLEYLNYYVDKHDIKSPQLMIKSRESFHQSQLPSLYAIPTFVVVDNEGNDICSYVGVKNIDEMIDSLYNF